LAERLADNRTRWRRLRVTGWYGQGERLLEIVSGTAIWHHPGHFVPIRYVLVRDVAGELRPQSFLYTDLHADPLDILGWFVRRWSIEVTLRRGPAASWGGNPATMVRFRHRSKHTCLAWFVLSDHPVVSRIGCRCSANAARYKLVPKASPDLQ
jgi:hypothetical protein